jgi:hypothetical protein
LQPVANVLSCFSSSGFISDGGPDPEDTRLPWNHVSPGSGRRIREDFLGERVGEHSGIGEAIVVRFAEDDVVENADAEDLRGFDQAVGTVAVFTRGSWVARGVIMLCAALSYVTSTGINAIFLRRCTVHTIFHST